MQWSPTAGDPACRHVLRLEVKSESRWCECDTSPAKSFAKSSVARGFPRPGNKVPATEALSWRSCACRVFQLGFTDLSIGAIFRRYGRSKFRPPSCASRGIFAGVVCAYGSTMPASAYGRPAGRPARLNQAPVPNAASSIATLNRRAIRYCALIRGESPGWRMPHSQESPVVDTNSPDRWAWSTRAAKPIG